MNAHITLKQVLLEEAEATYNVTEKLFGKVADEELMWKPAAGKNWMTVGQLLMHCANYGCGKAVQGFVKGEWDLTEDAELHDLDVEQQHIPPPAALSYVESVGQALELLLADRRLALRCIGEVEEADLLAKRFTAPWGGPELTLFQHLSLMIAHLAQHKGQLFYYLKLMGKDVNTSDLWGR
jgi:uncharacterized damage-inducible protein DinB